MKGLPTARPRGRRVLVIAALLVGLELSAPGGDGPRATALARADTPGITLALTPAGSPLAPQITLTATTALGPDTIAAIDFQYALADSRKWTSLGMNPTSAGSLPPYSVDVDAANLADGLYDFRAVLTDTAGSVLVAPTIRDQLVANSSPFVTLLEPGANLSTGSPLRLTVPLSATVSGSSAGFDVSTIGFEISRGDREQWRPIVTIAAPPKGAQETPVSFDTTRVPDGVYDLRAVPGDAAGKSAATVPVRGVIVDNTRPTVSLAAPGSPLSGTVSLTAQATDATSGVASVEFERARAGTGSFRRVGMAAQAPFSHAVDTTAWDNGAYDLRAVATDRAGNVAVSDAIPVTVVNAPQPPAMALSLQGVAVPAHAITLLGTVAGSTTHEAWAYGFSSAPPARIRGTPLPYTANGDQFVLLRYTDGSGWQIADVLRNPDGSAFKLVPADSPGGDPVQAAGDMTPSGEAWLWIREAGTSAASNLVGLFHRSPGGAFVFDSRATAAVGAGLLNTVPSPGQLRVRQASDGQAYGILTAAGQPARPVSVPGAVGTTVDVSGQLDYALLQQGTWAVRTASLPASYSPRTGDVVTLTKADVDAPGSGWGALVVDHGAGRLAPGGLLLGHFQADHWSYVATGLDALDLTGSVANSQATITPSGLKADGGGVWIGARVGLPTTDNPSDGGLVVARYDSASRRISRSWCSLPVANSCDEPLDHDHPAAVPDAIFDTARGPVALSLQRNVLDVYDRGTWTAVPAPGYSPAHGDAFSGPGEGWLGSQTALGQVSSQAPPRLLTTWPIAVRSPLTSVALPPGGTAGVDESGALAVGLSGATARYDAAAGWLVAPTPPRAHHINLTSVAFAGPSSAFAVGQFGLILRWDGSSWSEDPQSISLTQSPLNAVAFAPSGEGWAVGADGTILHYDGRQWSLEAPPPAFAATVITSVAVAGPDVFAIAAGHLITRGATGTWTEADTSLLPTDPAPVPGDLRLVAGLRDGGAVIAGRSVVLVRQHAGEPFAYSDQPLEGIAVGLAAFRDAGTVRAAVSLAPPAADTQAPFLPTRDIGGFPSGDGELLIDSAGGWQDLSRAQYAGLAGDLPPDGIVKSDPVLAVATSPDGRHAWAVGGYAGTASASGQGAAAVLPARPAGWQTASLWRYDAGGSAPAPALSTSSPDLPATPGIVSFAFFSSPACRVQCADTQDAQPDANLTGALQEISAYAAQPGGPAFAMLGGNARGPLDTVAYGNGNGTADFSRLPDLLAPLTVPLFAAFGPLDAVPLQADPGQPWSDAFAGAPAPMGNGGATPGITPVDPSSPTGVVHRHYSFDASQNGASLRVIVLDNSRGSLEASAVGQTAWLSQQLGAAAGLPIVVVAALPLHGNLTSDGASVAARLAAAGVVAVFTGNGLAPLNERHDVPDDASATVPEYEGATLGYQQPQNNGVVWYDVSIDTQAHSVSVNAVPVIESLSLQPLTGLSVARSLTLQFQAIGRRRAGSLATAVQYDDSFPGFDSYVEIPSPSCGSRPCVTPTYAFASSDPAIGNFVTPSGPGSPFPKLGATGHPISNPKSGLFCGYNAGTTNVSITAGLLTYSLPVTVRPGGFGAPCGTAPLPGAGSAVKHAAPAPSAAPAAAPPAPPPAAASAAPTPVVKLPPAPAPAAPAPAPHPAAAPQPIPQPAPAPQPAAPAPIIAVFPSLVPPITPAQPIPPGGATASSAAAARRREKAHKHASQSAFTTLTPRPNGAGWYYGAVGATTLLALMLSAQGLRPRWRPTEARVERRRR